MFGRKLASVLAGACLLALASTPARAADEVSVQLDWVVRGNHAMFFVAKELGYFAENGIEVTEIRKGTGSPDAMRLVGNGNAEFGFGDLPTLAVARSHGADDDPVTRTQEAVRFASAAGALAVTRHGAQPSLPRLQEVERLLAGVQV